MALRIYDTLAREKREFVPVTPGHVGMYVCGMTVQNKPHVGHIRASLSAEVMRRYFEHMGHRVTYVYNFTDVDDKIIERAATEGVEYQSVSERNIDAYLRFADLHNIKRATHYPRATQHIAEMHHMIAALICHMPAASSETSTSGASPVRSRCSSAAAMPPAMYIAPTASPNAGADWPGISSDSGDRSDAPSWTIARSADGSSNGNWIA